jgi:hypothetical protein
MMGVFGVLARADSGILEFRPAEFPIQGVGLNQELEILSDHPGMNAPDQ